MNCNFNFLISLQITNNRALGLTKDNDLLEWTIVNKINQQEKLDFSFLIQKPSFLINKIKFCKIYLNSTLTMGVTYNGSIFVWGDNKDGLLGLGYNVTDVDSPTELLNNIKELSISETHAVAIDSEGECFSWGSGKYGELCLDKRIYCPFPTKKSYDNEEEKYYGKKYKKVFCSDLLTCFIDEEGKFTYYGVIIKIFKGPSRSITIKSLLRDENNSDPNVLFQEKFVYELENEKFIEIAIGNGFLGLLSEKGLVYTIDHSDNINLLYTKYCVYSISVSNNQLFGVCKNSQNIEFPKDNTKNLNRSEDVILENIDISYFLCRWVAQYNNNEIISDSWVTKLYRNNDDIDLENMVLMNSNNKEILFIMQFVDNVKNNFNNENEINNINKNNISHNNTIDYKAKSFFREATIINENRIENFNISGFVKKNSIDNYSPLILVGYFDDSYNLKYKRVKNNNQGLRVISSKARKDNEFNDEHEELSDILNNSIRKKKINNTKSMYNEPFQLIGINDTKNRSNLNISNVNQNLGNNYEQNLKNKNLKSPILTNISTNEINVNYLLSPNVVNQKDFSAYSKDLKNPKKNIFNYENLYNKEDEINNASRDEKYLDYSNNIYNLSKIFFKLSKRE